MDKEFKSMMAEGIGGPQNTLESLDDMMYRCVKLTRANSVLEKGLVRTDPGFKKDLAAIQKKLADVSGMIEDLKMEFEMAVNKL